MRNSIRMSVVLAFAAGCAAAALLLAGGESPQAATGNAPTSLGLPDGNAGPGASEAEPVLAPVLPAAPQDRLQRKRPASGNPLWAVPLRALSATRERPLFSPSRRPPTPAVIAAPVATVPPAEPRPAAPERPPLTLVGTIIGEGDKIAIFFNPASKAVVRLRLGEADSGWVLRSVAAREIVLEKDRHTFILSLPAPDEPPPQGLPPSPDEVL
ncbi:general secretion pathway protein N [Rhizobiales bacterium GAS113]|nr:general secretion pathway protein N [Rhizobiales bacterium GAS113]SED12846.1 general secretion pathway protein N [Rhizobiales bacterium GAS188]